MATTKHIIAGLLAASLAAPALAVPPETVTSYCTDRAKGASGSVTPSITYRAGFVDGFLDAVLDSLR
jgi:hypothetical protein